ISTKGQPKKITTKVSAGISSRALLPRPQRRSVAPRRSTGRGRQAAEPGWVSVDICGIDPRHVGVPDGADGIVNAQSVAEPFGEVLATHDGPGGEAHMHETD